MNKRAKGGIWIILVVIILIITGWFIFNVYFSSQTENPSSNQNLESSSRYSEYQQQIAEVVPGTKPPKPPLG